MKDDQVGSNNYFSRPMIVAVSLIILISIACNAPTAAKKAVPDKGPGFVETSVAQTMIARNAGSEQGDADQADQEDQAGDSDPTATFTPEITDTPTNTPTITDTPTPEVAMVYSSANTNCRTGPDTAWPAIYTMNEGQSAEAIARGSVGDYWYINIPDQPGKTCVMWGKYATPSGPYELLPEWTPMPTPTPEGLAFTVSYHSYHDCGGLSYGLQYRVDNIGSKKIESWQTSVTDHTGGSNPVTVSHDTFFEYTNCVQQGIQNDLTPGEAYYLYSAFWNDPKGHDIATHIKVCTKDGLGGKCETKTVRHKP